MSAPSSNHECLIVHVDRLGWVGVVKVFSCTLSSFFSLPLWNINS